ncbi:MAG: DUF2141 domain-containing protein [Saprospirales bacterium]|nr:DUF2141 domain-containing protein [Saprospirales bacterium]MBK8489400.1 DUF2141 domain-containing protein [Saprospirales bacterium]
MLFSLLLCTLLMHPSNSSEKGTLQLEITNIRDTRGMIRVGVFQREDGFPDQEKVYWGGAFSPQKGEMIIDIPELPFGNYALAIYHDLNNNGRLDKNIWGIPTEPYGFSGAVKAKWSAPHFREVSFSFSPEIKKQRISLFKWEEL